MDIKVMVSYLENNLAEHTAFQQRCTTAYNYYDGKNDILTDPSPQNINTGCKSEMTESMRTADNRIPHNFMGIIVDQKIGYVLGIPPQFDVGNDSENTALKRDLTEEFPQFCQEIGVDASACGKGWAFVWEEGMFDEEGVRGKKRDYAIIDPRQIMEIRDTTLKKNLIAVIRRYNEIDFKTGDTYEVFEYWDDKECKMFRRALGADLGALEDYYAFDNIDTVTGMSEPTNVYPHSFGEIPFVEFPNNARRTSDLDKFKPLNDVYDKTYSGFINDVEDIQEVIFVLTNYGGQDLNELLTGLKQYKAIEVEDYGDGVKGGLQTLSIDIPVEAREKVLQMTRKSIFEQGQAIDPQMDKFGVASGVALKHLYQSLELKSSFVQTYFSTAFAKLIRLLTGKDYDHITQIWTRNAVSNDLEDAQIAQMSTEVISKEAIIKNHPWIDDVEAEKKDQQREKDEQMKMTDPFGSLPNEFNAYEEEEKVILNKEGDN